MMGVPHVIGACTAQLPVLPVAACGTLAAAELLRVVYHTNDERATS